MVDEETGLKKLTVQLPVDLHRRAKVAAAHGGQSMRDMIRRGLEAVLEGRA